MHSQRPCGGSGRRNRNVSGTRARGSHCAEHRGARKLRRSRDDERRTGGAFLGIARSPRKQAQELFIVERGKLTRLGGELESSIPMRPHQSSPTYSRAGSSSSPGLTAASVTVTAARTASALTAPVSASMPLGMSIASTARSRASSAREDGGMTRAAADALRCQRVRPQQSHLRATRPPQARLSAAERCARRRPRRASPPLARGRGRRRIGGNRAFISGRSSASAAKASPPLFPGPANATIGRSGVAIARSRSAIRLPALHISAPSPARPIPWASASRAAPGVRT